MPILNSEIRSYNIIFTRKKERLIQSLQENNLTQSRRELKDMYEAKKNLLSQMKQDSYKSICSNVENEINSKSYGYNISING